jgi:hypothetical protein
MMEIVLKLKRLGNQMVNCAENDWTKELRSAFADLEEMKMTQRRTMRRIRSCKMNRRKEKREKMMRGVEKAEKEEDMRTILIPC